jgi:multimeric flavodoxin WrbA
MKKILLVNASPRKGGNSDTITKMLAEDLKDCEVTVFNMREKKCNPCLACGACQGKDTQMCVQQDDIKELLPVIDQCDGIVLATPIYNQQICSQAKLFIERWYPFFKFDDPMMSNTSKRGKKGAIICSFWGSPVDVTTKYAKWTLDGFAQIGVEEKQALIFPHLINRGDVAKNEEYVARIHALANWLKE